MNMIRVLLLVMFYLTIGAFIDDVCRYQAEKDGKTSMDDISPFFVQLFWPIPVTMATFTLIFKRS